MTAGSPEEEDAAAHKRRGNALLAQDKPAEAAEAYGRAIEADPTVAAFWSNRSIALLKAGSAAAALRDADEAVRLAPDWPKGQLRRVRALEALGRRGEALEACGLGERAAKIGGAPEAEAKEFQRLREALSAAAAAANARAPTEQKATGAAGGDPAGSAHCLRGAAVAPFFDGVVSVETGDGWARPWRLLHGDRDLYDESLAAQAACAAVRIAVRTAGRFLRVVASTSVPEGVDGGTLERNGGFPMEYELFVNGALFAARQLGASEGKHTVSFDGLAEGEKDLELWLPPAVALDVHALDCGEAIARPLPDPRPVWACYGSSICHGGPTQASPSGTWPSICSTLANVRVVNLGFGGQCFLDPCVARVIRDLPCDCISLKVGINIQVLGALTHRTFPAALVGFVQTVRDGHPKAPLVLVSSIYGPMEDAAPINRPQFMTMVEFRACVATTVDNFRKLGDENIFYRDGLELLGKAEQALLYDGIHPSAEGHRLVGRRFAELEFGPAGRLLPGRLNSRAAAGAPEEAASAPARKELVGAYLVEIPSGGRCRMFVAEANSGLVCKSDRPDWPASPLHARGDLLFLRSTPGVWGRIQADGRAVTFSNGLTWVRAPGGPRPGAMPVKD